MKKFVLLFYGFEQPTPEVMKAWGDWFGKVGDAFVDSGNPFRGGVEVTKTESTPLPHDAHALTAYSIVNAASLEEAEGLLAGCPIIDSVRIYECATM